MSYFLPLLFLLLSIGFGQWIIDTDEELDQENSLEYIAQSTRNLESVWITIRGSRPLNLQDSVRFDNVSNLTLVSSSRTLLECGSKRAVGIAFFDSTNISMLGLTMSKCGYQWHNDSAILIHNCQNVKLEALYIGKSRGFALLFWDTRGLIQVNNSTFYKACQKYPACGGLGIVSTQCPFSPNSTDNTSTKYSVENSTFCQCNTKVKKENNKGLSGAEFGGGVGILFRGTGCLNDVVLNHCNFSGNSAYWGGGLFILHREMAKNNSVLVSNTVFSGNSATAVGGAVNVGFLPLSPVWVHSNKVTFQHCNFTTNDAKVAGGTAVFAFHINYASSEVVVLFFNCSWIGNTAEISTDVDLAPAQHDVVTHGFLPCVKFFDVYFHSSKEQPMSMNEAKRSSYGAFSSTLFNVEFGGSVVFHDLQYSALHLSSSTAMFSSGSRVEFVENRGTNGAAVAMYGFSFLHIEQNCSLRFIRNRATAFGGAIYFETSDKHEFVSASKCFIHYNGNISDPSKRNISVTFIDNHADRAGDAIYALTLYPCYQESHGSITGENLNHTSIFNIGKFTFSPTNRSLATAGARIISSTKSQEVIPGECHKFKARVEDELGQVYEDIFAVTVINDTVQSNTLSSLSSNGKLCLYEEPNKRNVLQMDTMNFRKLSYRINVTMLPCPPGFFLDSALFACKCSADDKQHAYPGIVKCNMTTFQAILEPNYWVGFVNNKMFTSPSPLGFCQHVHTLPKKSSSYKLNNLICGNNRRGILCGQCQNGLSVYYHSPKYTCGKSNYCMLGAIFFLLSEVLPLILVFSVIILFDIQITFGTANALTFFAQVLNEVSVDVKGKVNFSPPMEAVVSIYRVIYGIFDLDFFHVERLSFCLWKDAKVLDVLAFKYVTITIAVMLIILLILMLKFCQCKRVCSLKKKLNNQKSVIHGLTAILVMSYSQCIKVSFQILTKINLYAEGRSESIAVTFYGGLKYFEQEHLRYAIPACICIGTVVALPPLLLLIYPLYLKVFALCGAGESRFAAFVSQVLMIKKLRPFLDSFQGCYKDEFRFFAGLYFLYRIVILTANAFSSTTFQSHLIIELVVIIIIGIHSNTRPYQKVLHNAADVCILINIALINSLTIFAYYIVQTSPESYDSTFTVITSIQAALILLPMTAVFLFMMKTPVLRMYRRSQEDTSEEDTSEEIEMQHNDQDVIIDHEQLPYQEFGLNDN